MTSYDFVNLGDNNYKAEVGQKYPSSVQNYGAGTYNVSQILVFDTKGDIVTFSPGGSGIGLNYASGDLSKLNFEIIKRPDNQPKQSIASIGGFDLNDISTVIYNQVPMATTTVEISSLNSNIDTVRIKYKNPVGVTNQTEYVYTFSKPKDNKYAASPYTQGWQPGEYTIDWIMLVDTKGNNWMIFSEGRGTGVNFTSADLSKGSFTI